MIHEELVVHYNDVIMIAMASQITSLTIVYSTVYTGADRADIKAPHHCCAGNPPVTGEFPAQRASNAGNVSIRWRHHDTESHVKWDETLMKYTGQCMPINPSHKSHNALGKYPTMHHFVSEMCIYVHISVTKWCIVRMVLVHFGICGTGYGRNSLETVMNDRSNGNLNNICLFN